jgi:hypothetical protein
MTDFNGLSARDSRVGGRETGTQSLLLVDEKKPCMDAFFS